MTWVTHLHFSRAFSPYVKVESGRVTKSRFFLQSSNRSHNEAMMQGVRGIVDAAPFKVVAFNPFFLLFEQYLAVGEGTIQSVGLCLLVMAVISFGKDTHCQSPTSRKHHVVERF